MLSAQVALALSLFVSQPTPDQVKSVVDHFYKGQGKGVVLAEAILCKKVEEKAKDTKFDCIEEVGEAVAKGETINVWVNFLVPKDETVETVTVQAMLDGQVRETKDLALKGEGIRTRTWKSFKLAKPGKWEFQIRDGEKVLKTLSINAN